MTPHLRQPLCWRARLGLRMRRRLNLRLRKSGGRGACFTGKVAGTLASRKVTLDGVMALGGSRAGPGGTRTTRVVNPGQIVGATGRNSHKAAHQQAMARRVLPATLSLRCQRKPRAHRAIRTGSRGRVSHAMATGSLMVGVTVASLVKAGQRTVHQVVLRLRRRGPVLARTPLLATARRPILDPGARSLAIENLVTGNSVAPQVAPQVVRQPAVSAQATNAAAVVRSNRVIAVMVDAMVTGAMGAAVTRLDARRARSMRRRQRHRQRQPIVRSQRSWRSRTSSIPVARSGSSKTVDR